MVDYIIDKGLDKALITTPKLQLLKKKLGWSNNETDQQPQSQSLPVVNTIPTIPSPKTANDNILDKLASIEASMTKQVQEVDTRTGLVLSQFQIELDHFINKIQKAVPNLDYNNGDKNKNPTESPEEPKPNTKTNPPKIIEVDGYEFAEDELD